MTNFNYPTHFEDHWKELMSMYPRRNVVGLFLQGSQNYGLDYENSDTDTRAVLLPDLKSVAFVEKPVSTTHVRANDEHMTLQDVRLTLQLFLKQNVAFMELLFTGEFRVNGTYTDQWNRLVAKREELAHYNLPVFANSLLGMMKEKYAALEHHYPSKEGVLAKYGYDPKQLHHLLRLHEFAERFFGKAESFENCLRTEKAEYLLDVKRGLVYDLEEARKLAKDTLNASETFLHNMRDLTKYMKPDPELKDLLDDVQFQLMKRCLAEEVKEE